MTMLLSVKFSLWLNTFFFIQFDNYFVAYKIYSSVDMET